MNPGLIGRLMRWERGVHVIGWMAIIVGAAYTSWFIFWALDYGVWWFSIPLALANLQGYISVLSYLYSAWYQSPAPIPEAPAKGTLDVFIATYDESWEILAPSVVAAVAIRYPHATYVLDDGRREWVRDLCEKAGATWIIRPDNSDAKAGNLNNALAQTSGEFIVTLDADFIAAPSMADDLLGHFADPNVALVQSPQVFYNTDSFQHFNDGTEWNEQSLFHDVIMPAKNHWNAVYWCGSPAIVRRAALEAVGGVATGSVTEDIKTSVLLHRAGWRTLFDTRRLAFGVAPEDYQRFFRQRLRWTSGGLQLLRTQYWRGGFTMGQRLSYLASAGQAFGAARGVVIYMIPAFVLLTGTFPVRENAVAIAIIVLMPMSTLTANIVFGRGSYRVIRNELFGLVGLAAYLAAYPVLFGAPIAFGVTEKGRILGGRGLPPSLLVISAFIVLYVIATTVGILRLGGALPAPEYPEATTTIAAWSCVATVVFVAALTFALRHGRSAWRGVQGSWPATITAGADEMRATVTRLGMGRLEASVEGVTLAPEGDVEIHIASLGLTENGVVGRTERSGEGTRVWLELPEGSLALARFVGDGVFPDGIQPGPPSGRGVVSAASS